MPNSRGCWVILLVLVLLLLFALIVSACLPRPVREVHFEAENDWCKPVQFEDFEGDTLPFTNRENPNYWDSQVVVNGNPDDIDEVVLDLEQKLGVTFSLLDDVRFPAPSSRGDLAVAAIFIPLPSTPVALPPATPEVTPAATQPSDDVAPSQAQLSEPVVRQYQFSDGDEITVSRVILEFADAVEILNVNREPPLYVIAEPNYVISAGPHGVFGGPHGVFGGPHGVFGGPHGVFGGSSRQHARAAAAMFREQWALQTDSGIELMDGEGNVYQSNTASGFLPGQPAQVLIFDASRFAEIGMWEIVRPDWSMELCVHLPDTPYMAEVFSDAANASEGLYETRMNGELEELPVDAAIEHGLFAAGLVNVVAPGARVHLIRTIDDEGFGDMFSVIKILGSFVTTDYAYSVINMSFGLHLHEGEEEEDMDPDVIEAVRQMAIASGRSDLVIGPLDDPFVALRIPFLLAGLNHSLVVASAGNGSAELEMPDTMNYPGRWGELPVNGQTLPILGVGASSLDRDWTCYSNDGEVLAPGGDGKTPLSVWPSYHCRPAAHKCPEIEASQEMESPCKFGIISLVSSAGATTGYGYWSGTSFSSPMVAGLAALVLEDQPQTGGLFPEPATVKSAILSGACSSENNRPIINVPKTLGLTPESQDC